MSMSSINQRIECQELAKGLTKLAIQATPKEKIPDQHDTNMKNMKEIFDSLAKNKCGKASTLILSININKPKDEIQRMLEGFNYFEQWHKKRIKDEIHPES